MRSRAILTLIISALSPIAVLGLLRARTVPNAPTPLRSIAFCPDRIVKLGGTTLAPNQVGIDDLSGTVTVVSFPGVPDEVQITGYHQLPGGQQLLTFDRSVSLPSSRGGSITADPRDVVSFDGSGYGLFFNGASSGIPLGVAINSLSLIADSDLLLSFDSPVSLPAANGGSITAQRSDLVRLGPTGFSMFFSGAAAGAQDRWSGLLKQQWPLADLFQRQRHDRWSQV